MGYFSSIFGKDVNGEDVELQFKNAGDDDPQSFEVGDKITTPDGIHFCYEGCFVVKDGIIIALFVAEDNQLFTKWGDILPFPDINDKNPLKIWLNKQKPQP